MLQTINGFDFLLIGVIVVLFINISLLHREANDYVEQLMRLSEKMSRLERANERKGK